MTTLETMYSGVAGSPETILTVQYVAGTSATITVEDASVLPDAPNRVVIQRTDLAFVTVFYGSLTGNVLGVLTIEAGFTGTYPIGSTAARRFCESDHEELRDNVTALNSGKLDADANAVSASKLRSVRFIDGLSFDGSTSVTRYGVCSTNAKTAAKTVAINGNGFAGFPGSMVVVKFTHGNVANSPTLNVASLGARPITRNGVPISPEKIEVGGTYVFVYDGTNYEIIGSYIDKSPITIHGMIIDETNSDPQACISYIGASAGLSLAERKAVFESSHPFVVVKAAEELFTVDPNDWSKKLDGTDSGVTTDGLSLNGNFMIRYPTFWFRIQTLGTDIHSIEWTHDNPGSGNGWVCCHWRDGTIRDKVWVGVTKGIVDGGKLRAIYSDTELPTTDRTSEQFYTAAQATGTADGLTGDDNTYTITQPLVYIMRCILKYWTYGTLDLQTDVARGLVDDLNPTVIGRRPLCVGVSPSGGYTQGIAASEQEYTDNVSAVVCGEIDPYGALWEFVIDFAYRFGEIAFSTDAADHFNVGTLTLSPDNWDSAIPATWSKATGVGTTSGHTRKMLWNASFPFVSASTTGGSALTYWSDYTQRSTNDTVENKVPHCCISGGTWLTASGSGPAYLHLGYSANASGSNLGARLQIFSKE